MAGIRWLVEKGHVNLQNNAAATKAFQSSIVAKAIQRKRLGVGV